MPKFEVAAIHGIGLGLRATQDIGKGELVLKEKHVMRALLTVLREQRVPPHIFALIVTDKKQDCALHLKNYIEKEISANDKPAVMDLYDPNPNGPADEKMARIYLCNSFADGGLFPICSRMNHSCKPAVQMSSDDEIETEVRALKDIKAGEEITVSYIRTSDLGTKEERAETLRRRTGGFECHCEICSLTEEDQKRNDQLRTKVKRVMHHTKDFIDGLFVLGPMRPTAYSGLYLSETYFDAQYNLDILHGREAPMEGEAEAALLIILLDLALLAKVANTQLWRTELGQAMHTPGIFLNRAKEKAGQLGTMFVSNCATREEEMERIREMGSEMDMNEMNFMQMMAMTNIMGLGGP